MRRARQGGRFLPADGRHSPSASSISVETFGSGGCPLWHSACLATLWRRRFSHVMTVARRDWRSQDDSSPAGFVRASRAGVSVPTAESILAWATVVANDWRWLAILWHVALAALLIGFVTRVRLSTRLVGYALVLPVISVSVIAWLSRNPFNGLIFAVLAVLLRARRDAPAADSRDTCIVGMGSRGGRARRFWMGLPSFPHHGYMDGLRVRVAVRASPLPDAFGRDRDHVDLRRPALKGWSAPLFGAGILYGWIGIFRLSVSLDIWLFAGAILLGVMVVGDLIPGPFARPMTSEHDVFLATSSLLQRSER